MSESEKGEQEKEEEEEQIEGAGGKSKQKKEEKEEYWQNATKESPQGCKQGLISSTGFQHVACQQIMYLFASYWLCA